MEPGNMEPGNMEPGNMEPGNMEPGNMEPGNMEPGNMEPGNMEPGNMEPGGECGDGTVDEGEECDDGNMTDGDGCAADCTIEEEPGDCLAPATFGTPMVADYFLTDFSLEAGIVGLLAPLNDDSDVLAIELYDGYGVFTDGIGTNMTYVLAGDELNQADCGLCVSVFTDCDLDAGECSEEPLYFATGGMVEVTELEAGQITLKLTNVEFEHKGLDANDETITNDSMCTTAIASMDIDFDFPVCGDMVVEGEEQCDDGNDDELDGCNSSCETTSVCGDMTVDMDEECDDGNRVDGDGCEADCTNTPVCGNGIEEDGEACDDGNMVDDDSCTNLCEVNAICGDGILNEGEECDDGNMTDGDGCSAMCLLDLCFADADYGTATLSNALADYDGSDAFGIAELNADTDLLLIELYDGFGAFANGLTTGMVTITGDEANYETCGACVLLRTDCDDNTGQGCDPATAPVYMATGGTINIIELSPNLKVDLSNVTFDHVDIDENTFASTPHRDMCTSGIVSASFDAPSVMNP